MSVETNPEQVENVLLIAPAETVAEDAVTLVATDSAAAEPSALDNALTLGLVGILALVVIIAVIRKALSNKKAATATVEEVAEVPVEAADAPTAPGSAGEIKLHNVEPKTAAMLMAIVADKLQKPINELRFISIKEVE